MRVNVQPSTRQAIRIMATSVVAAASLILSACTTTSEPLRPPSTAPTTSNEPPPFGPVGAPGCTPASPHALNEFQGTPADDATIAYGVFQGGSPDTLYTSFLNGGSVKFVFRMTGSGDLKALLRSPAGAVRNLTWGPEAHTSSSYDRPGDEWGMGFSVNSPGCWELEFRRSGQGAASFWFQIPQP